MVENVRQTPVKGAYETIIVALVVPAFTPVHVVLPERQNREQYTGAVSRSKRAGAGIACSCRLPLLLRPSYTSIA
jgi:hypothetical protein